MHAADRARLRTGCLGLHGGLFKRVAGLGGIRIGRSGVEEGFESPAVRSIGVKLKPGILEWRLHRKTGCTAPVRRDRLGRDRGRLGDLSKEGVVQEGRAVGGHGRRSLVRVVGPGPDVAVAAFASGWIGRRLRLSRTGRGQDTRVFGTRVFFVDVSGSGRVHQSVGVRPVTGPVALLGSPVPSLVEGRRFGAGNDLLGQHTVRLGLEQQMLFRPVIDGTHGFGRCMQHRGRQFERGIVRRPGDSRLERAITGSGRFLPGCRLGNEARRHGRLRRHGRGIAEQGLERVQAAALVLRVHRSLAVVRQTRRRNRDMGRAGGVEGHARRAPSP